MLPLREKLSYLESYHSPETFIPSSQRDGLRRLKSVALLQLLPALDGAGLNAQHVLPAILGRKVLDAGGLVNPGVPDHNLIEVVADDTVARAAGLGDDDGVLGTVGGRVNGIGLAREGDGAGLSGLRARDFGEVNRVLETCDLSRGNILRVVS